MFCGRSFPAASRRRVNTARRQAADRRKNNLPVQSVFPALFYVSSTIGFSFIFFLFSSRSPRSRRDGKPTTRGVEFMNSGRRLRAVKRPHSLRRRAPVSLSLTLPLVSLFWPSVEAKCLQLLPVCVCNQPQPPVPFLLIPASFDSSDAPQTPGQTGSAVSCCRRRVQPDDHPKPWLGASKEGRGPYSCCFRSFAHLLRSFSRSRRPPMRKPQRQVSSGG